MCQTFEKALKVSLGAQVKPANQITDLVAQLETAALTDIEPRHETGDVLVHRSDGHRRDGVRQISICDGCEAIEALGLPLGMLFLNPWQSGLNSMNRICDQKTAGQMHKIIKSSNIGNRTSQPGNDSQDEGGYFQCRLLAKNHLNASLLQQGSLLCSRRPVAPTHSAGAGNSHISNMIGKTSRLSG